MQMLRNRMLAVIWCVALSATGGCSWIEERFGSNSKKLPEPVAAPARSADPLFRDTVGNETLYGDAAPMQIRGYGLVTGLGEKGSSDCPTAIREYLVDFINREYQPANPGSYKQRVSPNKLIDSLDTAVVEITGTIAPGAPRGSIFDVQVEALRGSSTQTLEGGLLIPTELRIFDTNASGTGLLAGRVVARASGPVFVNPALRAISTTDRNVRRGVVLGGGRTTEERSVQLQLIEPSYPQARKLERAVSERFGPGVRVAEALSQSYVVLHTPASMKEDPRRFLSIVPFIATLDDPGFRERRARELGELARARPNNLEEVSLGWEALGSSAFPALRPLYDEAASSIGYYAARAGLRNGDTQALGVIEAIARSRSHPNAIDAIRELGKSRFGSAAQTLAGLVDGSQNDHRIAAYEGLVRLGHPRVQRRTYASALDPAQPNVIVDVIDCEGAPLIYFKRTRSPVIAVFGKSMPVATPVFYTDPDDRLTISSEEAGTLTLFARGRTSGRLSSKVVVPADVASLIGALADVPLFAEKNRKKLRGLGASYSEVIHVLAALTEEQKVIPATLVPEQIRIEELLGPLPLPERAATDREASESPKAPREDSRDAPRRDDSPEAETERWRRGEGDDRTPGDAVNSGNLPPTEGAPELQSRPQPPPKKKKESDLWDG